MHTSFPHRYISYSFIVIIWLLAIIIQWNSQMHLLHESKTKTERENNNYPIELNMLLIQHFFYFMLFNVNSEFTECFIEFA